MVGPALRSAVVATVAWTGCTPAAPPAANPRVAERAPVAATSRADENQPAYWIEKLGDSTRRAAAVSRLWEMFEDVVLRSDESREAPELRDFVDETLEPLSELYVREYERLDPKTRVTIIKLLAHYRDERTVPALKKAFEAFARAPKTSRDEMDIKWAARAQEELRVESLSMPLLQAFLKFRASSMLGGVAYVDVHRAIRRQPANQAWVAPLVATLEVDMGSVDAKDKRSFDEYRDRFFWQATAAETLGRLGDSRAVEPLYKVLLDPAKVDISYTAGLALIQLGRPAHDVALQLLKSEHAALQAFHVRRAREVTGSEPKGRPWVVLAARVLGAAGRPEAVAPLIAAVEAERDDDSKLVVVDALSRIRGTPESKEAFKKAFRGAPVEALPELAEAMGRFLDPELVPWILQTAARLGGPKSEREQAQEKLLGTALRLARPSQMNGVKAAAEKFAAKDLVAKVEPLVSRCKEDGFCYLAALKSAENQNESNQMIGIKAGYMVGILGNDELRDELVASLGQIPTPTLRFVAAQAIDHLTPAGSRVVAQKLREIIERNEKSPDRDKAAGDNSLKQVMIRLDARRD